ncbi:MAG: hypothetical protein GXP55_10190, partial [Deltaproteobacteria bacterium]|nr:hypothetical protein [Deltaproteobacteria bacterium]
MFNPASRLRPLSCLRPLGLATLVLLGACATTLPSRMVVEHNLGPYAYRRYQRTLDVEFAVQGNAAVGHTATYVRRHGDHPLLATAFVTVYDHAPGLAAELLERLESLGTYDRSVVKVSGEWVHRLESGNETWLVWVSGKHIVKLGAPRGREMPDEVADTYLDLYPSDLDEHGRAEEGADSAGPSQTQHEEEGELDLPS